MTLTHPGVEQARGRASERASKQQDEKSREVRLGLVLYGGVSLAIYINGVANEFFRAVRGRGVYRLLKALTDSDVVVDVVSGTSAGGINGIFLAFCLCNEGSEFSRTAALWRESGDIRELLRSPEDREATYSLLNSENYYEPRLRQALARLYPCSTSRDWERDFSKGDFPEDPSHVGELDLFVTGTDVDGNVSTRFDDAGTSIDIKNHRSVFLLKHREGRKLPFRPKWPGAREKDLQSDATVRALAKLACITSCFPAAFKPVPVSTRKEDPDRTEEDHLLGGWGRLASDSVRCFLDGGVLDNKPFSYTLKTIFSRHAVREVDRKLCYLEPVPESYKPVRTSTRPDILKALVTALIGIPGYESIDEDLQALADHNSRVERYNRILAELREAGDGAAQEASPTQKALYQRSRLIAFSERVLQGLFREEGRDVPLPLREPKVRARGAALANGLDLGASARKDTLPQPGREHVPGARAVRRGLEDLDVHHILDDLDVTIRLRRLYHTVYFLRDFLYKSPPAQSLSKTQVQDYRALRHALNRRIELHEIIQAAVGWLLDHAPFDWKRFAVSNSSGDVKALWCQVQHALERLLDDSARPGRLLLKACHGEDPREWLEKDELSKFHQALREHAESIVQEIKQSGWVGTKATGRSLLHTLAAQEDALLEHFIPGADGANPAACVKQAYAGFNTIDTLLFPIDLMGGVREKDIIRTLRISPEDAHRGFSRRSARDKLSGDLAHHFGGFFKRSWRANDILWGRLDGVCKLVEILLTRERLQRLRSDEGLLQTVRERMLKSPKARQSPLKEEYAPEKLFPRSGSRTHERLRQWFQQLLAVEADGREDPLLDNIFEDMRELLIEAAQLEVLDRELPHVCEDTRSELEAWKGERLVRGRELREAEARLAAMRLQLEQARTRPGSEDAGRPTDTALGRYFLCGYTVGQEKLLKDIPFMVLLDVAARTLPVLRNGLLGLTKNVPATTSWGFRRGALRLVIRSVIGLATAARWFLKLQRHVPVLTSRSPPPEAPPVPSLSPTAPEPASAPAFAPM